MIPETLLLKLLVAALDQLPEHRLEDSPESWARIMDGRMSQSGGGLMLSQHAGVVTAKLADHEDRAVMVDNARRAGYLVIDSPEVVLGFEFEP